MRFPTFPKAAIAALAIACLSGCVTTVQMNVRTQPGGAQLYADGHYLGTGAGSVGAQLRKGQWNAGQHCVVLPPVDARWVSGAEVQMPPRRVCLQAFTGGIVYRDVLIERPRGVPGLGMDLDYADQLARQRLAERQALAAEAAATAEARRARALEIRLHERQREDHHDEHHHRHDHGDHRHQGHHDQGHRDQGHHEQGHHDQGHRDQGHHDQGHHDQGYHDQGYHDQSHHEQGHHEQGHHDQGHHEQGRHEQGHRDQGTGHGTPRRLAGQMPPPARRKPKATRHAVKSKAKKDHEHKAKAEAGNSHPERNPKRLDPAGGAPPGG